MGAEAQQTILSLCRDLFMRYGIKSITMDDIARKLGVSKKTLYQYVENKEDLIQQVIYQHTLEEKEAIEQIVLEANNAVEEIYLIAKYVVGLLRQVSPTTMYDLQKYYRNIWDMMEALHQQFILTIIKANLERGITEELYRHDLDVDVIAQLYVGNTSLITNEDFFPLKEYARDRIFTEFIKYHIRGIASSKGLKTLKKLKAI